MSRSKQALRGTARALSGAVVLGVAGVAVIAAGSLALPTVDREPTKITVDTSRDVQRTLSCAGSFTELGADPSKPDEVVPVGSPSVLLAGDAEARKPLKRSEKGDGRPAVYAAPESETFAAAQVQTVETETLLGTVASACAEASNSQWLVGGSSEVGASTTVSVSNPGDVPATVSMTVYDEDGEVSGAGGSSVLVPAGTQQVVSINGYAPDRKQLAVHVESVGAAVVANLGVGQVSGLQPYAVSSATAQADPSRSLVIPGVRSDISKRNSASDAGKGDAVPVTVRAVAPGGEKGKAKVWALDKSGKKIRIGTLELKKAASAELSVESWPTGAVAVLVEADVPVVAGGRATAADGDTHDYEWLAPAPEIVLGTDAAAPVVTGGRLVIANTGAEDAHVVLTPAKGKKVQADVRAGGAVSIEAPEKSMLSTTAPVHAGVLISSGGAIAGYPILVPDPRDGTLDVYTR